MKAIKYILPFNSEMYLIACIPRLNIFLIWTIQHISKFYKKKKLSSSRLKFMIDNFSKQFWTLTFVYERQTIISKRKIQTYTTGKILKSKLSSSSDAYL